MAESEYKKAPGKPDRIVVALGGNALGDNPTEQMERLNVAAPALLDLINETTEIVITHGNGPQVCMIQKAFAIASDANPSVPAMDLPECVAMSQGYIGYHMQKGIGNEIRHRGKPWHVATIVTEVEVDKDDPAFENPTKPIGQFLTKEQADMQKLENPDWTFVEDSGRGYRRVVASPQPKFENPTKPIGQFLTKEQADMQKLENPDWTFVEDSGRGYRRVVASPQPKAIVEIGSIRHLLDAEYIVIACGGGGIPVYEQDNALVGVGAVIDKDLAGELLAEDVDAEKLILLTAVDHVAINFGKPDQEDLTDITVEQAKKYVEEGQFGKGSMEPKVKAAIKFAESRPGRVAIIGSLEKAAAAANGESGTRIHL